MTTALAPAPTHPFGLPPGSVRGLMSLLICGFFWIVLLLPGTDKPITPPLGHFFLLALVLLAFSSSATAKTDDGSPTLPWLLRVLFVGGSIAVAALILIQFPDRLPGRITPDPEEVRQWWGPFMGCTFGGFAAGLFLRFVLGRENYVFLTIRSWLSVLGLVMLTIEIGLFVLFVTATVQASSDFLQIWDAVELVIVAAYFGTRA